jgi:hypothetical protein
LVYQKDRDVIANRIDAVACVAFQSFRVRLQDEGFFANRANQDFKQVLRNHEAYCTTRIAERHCRSESPTQFKMEDSEISIQKFRNIVRRLASSGKAFDRKS